MRWILPYVAAVSPRGRRGDRVEEPRSAEPIREPESNGKTSKAAQPRHTGNARSGNRLEDR